MAVNNIYTYKIIHDLSLTGGEISGTMYTDTIKVHKGMDDTISVSYTHLTLPTNREV